MPDLNNIEVLQERIRLLESENERLTERAEDTLMLDVVSEAIEQADDIRSGLNAALERVAVLKGIPIVAYCAMNHDKATTLQSYVAFSDTGINNFSFSLPEINGHSVMMQHDHPSISQLHIPHMDFTPNQALLIPHIDFTPNQALLIPAMGRNKKEYIFLFASDEDGDRLQRITSLLERIVHTITTFIENRTLLESYKERNEELDYRVALRSKALQESERKYRDLIDQMQDCFYRTDAEGRLVYASPSIQTLLACELDELIGDELSNYYVDPNGRQKFLALLQASPDGKVDCFEAQIRRKDGEVIWLSANTHLIYDNEGNVQGVEGSLRDITSLKEMEVKFNQAQKMEAMGTLVGGIAHDFNNILASMVGSFYLIKYKQQNNPELVRDIELLEQQSFRAADMIKQLLTFSRKGKIETKNFSFTLLMEEALKLAMRTVPENIKLNANTCKKALLINGDASLLQQVLMNLINNSRDAMSRTEKPSININIQPFQADVAFIQRHPEVALATAYAHLSIQDNGCGISEESLRHVFEPFYTTKGVGEGTGLGLAMIYGSIQSHQGFIELNSIVDEGTTIDIFLPIMAPDEHKIETASKNNLLEGQGEFILYVDDEADVCEVNSDILTSFGYQVLQANDGLDAIKVFERHKDKISLVLTDVVMPNMGGVELAKELWVNAPSLPIIFVSGYDESHFLEIPKTAKHTYILEKPFAVEALSQHVRRLLESSSI